MKLGQTINRSQRSPGGIVGQTKTESYFLEWELVYHEIITYSNCYSDLTKSKTRTGPALHHELTGRISKQQSEEVIKVRKFITEWGNPYETSRPTPLHDITSGLVVPKEHSKLLLKYFDGGKQQCKLFCDERYVKKSYKLCGTIRKVNIPKFDYKYKKQKFLKPTAKKLGDAQKHIDVARARGILTKEILCSRKQKSFWGRFDSNNRKKWLSERTGETPYFFDYNFTSESQLRTAVIVAFMSLIRRYPASKLKTFNNLFSIATNSILHAPCVDEIDIVYDSYL